MQNNIKNSRFDKNTYNFLLLITLYKNYKHILFRIRIQN